MTTTADGVKTFDYAAGTTPQQAEDFATGLATVDGIVIGGPAGIDLADAPHAQAFLAKASAYCNGRNQVWDDIWGRHAEIDSCVTQNMIGATGLGASAERLLGILAGVFAMHGDAVM